MVKNVDWASGWVQILRVQLNVRNWCVCVCVHSVPSDSLQSPGLQLTRLLCPWNFLGKNTGVDFHFLLQGIFLTQGSKLSLLHFFKFIFLLKNNCFTEFCFFFSNLNMNQPQVYIYPLPFEPPSHLLLLFEFPEPYSKFLLAVYFTCNVSFHVTLSILLTLSSPLPVSISLFSMSVSPLLPCK